MATFTRQTIRRSITLKNADMRFMRYSLLSFLFFFATLPIASAQSADFMRSIGKIYVVVAVVMAVFIGIVIFLIIQEYRLTKLENQIKKYGED